MNGRKYQNDRDVNSDPGSVHIFSLHQLCNAPLSGLRTPTVHQRVGDLLTKRGNQSQLRVVREADAKVLQRKDGN
jgi:hypothetical protein